MGKKDVHLGQGKRIYCIRVHSQLNYIFRTCEIYGLILNEIPSKCSEISHTSELRQHTEEKEKNTIISF